MCIIVVKPQGKAPLPMDTLFACWGNNPHGAGFVIRRPGHDNLLIQKGFMTFEELLSALSASVIQASDTVIYHFRIATSGSITPANCHPFPISRDINDLKSLTIACQTAFAHNGILGKGSADLSDTQLYILNTLSRYPGLNANLAKIRKDTAGSRTAILNANGQLWLTGKWLQEGGYYYSNDSYVYQSWWDAFCDTDSGPERCDLCGSKLPLQERGGILLCKECSASYAACCHCGGWHVIEEMEAVDNDNGRQDFACFACAGDIPYYFDWDDEEPCMQAILGRFLQS